MWPDNQPKETLMKVPSHLYIDRITQIRSTEEIVWENMIDWTHFMYVHRRHFRTFHVLYENETTQVFYYEMKIFPWLPLVRRSIAVREINQNDRSFTQAYLDLPDGSSVHYLKNSMRVLESPNGGESECLIELRDESLIALTGLFRMLPRRLLVWLATRRQDALWDEDREMILERTQVGGFTNSKCKPHIQSLYDRLSSGAGQYLNRQRAMLNELPAYRVEDDPLRIVQSNNKCTDMVE